MPALNFQARFAPLVESGQKRQTIRALRKRPIRQGDTLYLYTGQRRPGAKLLKTTLCTEARAIEICLSGEGAGIFMDGTRLLTETRAALAAADGFETVNQLIEWFRQTHGLSEERPFRGQVIRW